MRALLILLPLSLCGCVSIAKTAVDVATLPVKAVGAGVDAVTTTQSEADEDRGRALRKAEEKHGKAIREWEEECAVLRAHDRECPPPPRYEPPEE